MNLFDIGSFGSWSYDQNTATISFTSIPGADSPPRTVSKTLDELCLMLSDDDRSIVQKMLSEPSYNNQINRTITPILEGKLFRLLLRGSFEQEASLCTGVFVVDSLEQSGPPDMHRLMNVMHVVSDISSFIVYEMDFPAHISARYTGIKNVLGYEPDETPGDVDWWISIIHPDDREDILGQFYNVTPGTENVVMNYRVQRKDGKYIYVQDRSRIVWNGEQMQHMVGVTEDVTGKYEANQALLAAKESAEAANSAKTDFLANLSHELRTPLSALVGFAELVQDPKLDKETQMSYLDKVLKNSRHIGDAISNLIDMSAFESGNVAIRRETIRFHDFVKLLRSRYETKSSKSGIGLEFTVGETMPDEIRSDKPKLMQIINILMTHAFKFSKIGPIKANLEFDGSTVTFEVTDTGPGIEKEISEHIFDAVEMMHRSSQALPGIGLSLALARNFARMIGGNLVLVPSGSDDGSTFRFTFPAEMSDETYGMGRDRMSSAKVSTLPSEQGPILAGKRILVVEDIDENYKLIETILQTNGAAVERAAHGYDALDNMRYQEMDLIVVDVAIPGIDGLNLTRILRQKNTEYPIVAYGELNLDNTASEAMKAGCNAYLKMPIDVDQLISTVSSLLPE